MSDNPNAEIIAIGTEILLGEITDTNSVFMARQLRDIGVNVFFMTTVGDNLQRIADAIDSALGRAEIVITCGGLGPTVDDMTRPAVANATHRQLEFHQSLYDAIAERFRGFGVDMTTNNRQQAFLPQAASVIENPVGTAPGFIVETKRGLVISLPGVPREMKYLFSSSVVPYLLRQYDLGIIVARTLRTAGIGESSLDDKIGTAILSGGNPTVGLAAHHGSVDVRITAKADTKAKALRLLDEMQAKLEAKIGEHIFGIDDATLEAVVFDLLQEHNLTIHVTEAGLPGVITNSWNGEAAYVQSDLYDHPNEVYERYAIDSSAVPLKDFAIDIAQHIRTRQNVDASILVLSYPDLDENADVKQGSAVAVSTAQDTRYRAYGFGTKSNLARDWLARWGLACLWRLLREEHSQMA